MGTDEPATYAIEVVGRMRDLRKTIRRRAISCVLPSTGQVSERQWREQPIGGIVIT